MRGENVSLQARMKRVMGELDAAAEDATRQLWGLVESASRWGQRTLAEISRTLNRVQDRARRAAH